MQQEDDIVTAVRLELAEIKGMVTQSLSNQAQQITAATVQISSLNNKVNMHDIEIGKTAVNIDNLQKSLESAMRHHEKDMVDVKANQSGQLARVFTVITPIIAGAAILLAVVKDIYLPVG